MIRKPMDVLTQHPVRRSKNQKKAFRKDVTAYLKGLGYSCRTEEGSLGAQNLLAGDPEKAEFLITAHYDTGPKLLFPHLTVPCELPFFLLYQLLFFAAILLLPAAFALGIYGLTRNLILSYWLFLGLVLLMFLGRLAGPANQRNANGNTSGVVTVLSVAQSLPEALRHKVCFVFFDLKEVCFLGSYAYRCRHKAAVQNQTVLNLDCMGDGNEIVFFPTKQVKRNKNTMEMLDFLYGRYGKKALWTRKRGFGFCPSDHNNFPNGIGITALRRCALGRYLGRIHTNRDVILDQTNVNILRAALISLVGRTAMEERK